MDSFFLSLTLLFLFFFPLPKELLASWMYNTSQKNYLQYVFWCYVFRVNLKAKCFLGLKKFIVTLTMYTINCVNIITVTYQLFYEIEQNIDSCMSVIPVLRFFFQGFCQKLHCLWIPLFVAIVIVELPFLKEYYSVWNIFYPTHHPISLFIQT